VSSCSVENQLWGFTRDRRDFFETYYLTALESAYRGRNAWDALVTKVDNELLDKENIPIEEVCLLIGAQGPSAEQPGHPFRDGYGRKDRPSLIDKGELSRVFNAKSKAEPSACPNLDVVWAPAERVYPAQKPGAKSFWAKLQGVLKMSAGAG
jgi:hypothetical protein